MKKNIKPKQITDWQRDGYDSREEYELVLNLQEFLKDAYSSNNISIDWKECAEVYKKLRNHAHF